MLLAGDLGGTKTLLGLFERGERRPQHILSRAYPTQEFDSFTAILDAFTARVLAPQGDGDQKEGGSRGEERENPEGNRAGDRGFAEIFLPLGVDRFLSE